MNPPAASFITVGENIHCTRIYKIGGKFVKALDDGSYAIIYSVDDEERHMPIPQHVIESEEWSKKKKVRHVAVAMWQGFYGADTEKQAGIAYLQYLARVQEAHGAAFLDLNVDEFSMDVDERIRIIQWAAEIIQRTATIPLSIDSSDISILQAGLAACDPSRGKPLVNSISLERAAGIEIARNAGAAVIAGATGETSMPSTVEERLANFERLVPRLTETGFTHPDIYLDPLVFPASVDPQNSKRVLDTIAALRKKYGPEIHFAPGLSNVSYGLPKRKHLNQVFAYLCMEQGCDGGLVDPRHINAEVLGSLDTDTEAFALTKAFLMGEDEFGMDYILAVRQGVI